MTLLEIAGMAVALIGIVIAAVCTFAPLAGFTEDADEADAQNAQFRRTDGE
jgi:hypothetical protein